MTTGGPPGDAPELAGTTRKGFKIFDSDDDATGPVGSGGGTHDRPMESTNVDDGTSLVSAANTYEWADPKYAGAASHVLNAPMLESVESACSHHDVKLD